MENDNDKINKLETRIKELEQINENLKDELEDIKILNENTLEHSSTLENELVEQNLKMELLQKKMKKYLSPQLYEALIGGKADATLIHTRKKLTIFFSDIVGFTEITDSIEPELLSDILNSYLDRMASIAIKWGGTIDKFVGDAVMVFFGDPEFIDDRTHAVNCVNMALEMRDALSDLTDEWKKKGIDETFHIRIGINTGFCTVGNFGSDNRMDYTIIGGQVNIAARLEKAAKPDSIYISSNTNNFVKDIVNTKYVDSVKVKGIHFPIEVYEVLGLKEKNIEQPKKKSEPITLTKDGFIINNLKFNSNLAQKEDKLTILNSLQKAISILEKSLNPTKNKEEE
ncbi:MAG: adenylate/guanylate cyclase domain-containing protein [Spirochaetota bacterium]